MYDNYLIKKETFIVYNIQRALRRQLKLMWIHIRQTKYYKLM